MGIGYILRVRVVLDELLEVANRLDAFSGINESATEAIDNLVETRILGILTQDLLVDLLRVAVVRLRLLTAVRRSALLGSLNTLVPLGSLFEILPISELPHQLGLLEHPLRLVVAVGLRLDDPIELADHLPVLLAQPLLELRDLLGSHLLLLVLELLERGLGTFRTVLFGTVLVETLAELSARFSASFACRPRRLSRAPPWRRPARLRSRQTRPHPRGRG